MNTNWTSLRIDEIEMRSNEREAENIRAAHIRSRRLVFVSHFFSFVQFKFILSFYERAEHSRSHTIQLCNGFFFSFYLRVVLCVEVFQLHSKNANHCRADKMLIVFFVADIKWSRVVSATRGNEEWSDLSKLIFLLFHEKFLLSITVLCIISTICIWMASILLFCEKMSERNRKSVREKSRNCRDENLSSIRDFCLIVDSPSQFPSPTFMLIQFDHSLKF